MKTKTKIIKPRKIRDFTDSELLYMKDMICGKKTFNNATREFKLHLRTFIALIENNKPNTNGYVELPKEFLSKVFKSKVTLTKLKNFAIRNNKIIVCDGKYDSKHGKCLGYKLHERFKLSSLIKFEKESIENPIIIIEQPQPQIMKQEEKKTTQSIEEKTILKVIQKHNNDFFHKRVMDIGLNPTDEKECVECEMCLPLYLFSISKDKKLNCKCKICFAMDELQKESLKDESDFMEEIQNFMNDRKAYSLRVSPVSRIYDRNRSRLKETLKYCNELN